MNSRQAKREAYAGAGILLAGVLERSSVAELLVEAGRLEERQLRPGDRQRLQLAAEELLVQLLEVANRGEPPTPRRRAARQLAGQLAATDTGELVDHAELAS